MSSIRKDCRNCRKKMRPERRWAIALANCSRIKSWSERPLRSKICTRFLKMIYSSKSARIKFSDSREIVVFALLMQRR